MDRSVKKGIAVVAAGFAASVAAAGLYMANYEPSRRETGDLRVEPTPERLERGQHLVEHVVGCLDCHTARDRSAFLLPATGPLGAGGECYGPEQGFPGRVCTPNITPDAETGLGSWSDDEILRAIREGVSRDGRALFPMMPYTAYASMSDEDAYSVIAYLRTLPPVRNAVPTSEIDFPVSFFIARVPQPIQSSVGAPAAGRTVDYGRYLATIAGCRSCHLDNLSGGYELPTPRGIVRSSNLTPDDTGVTPPELDDFIRMFRAFAPDNQPQLMIEPERYTTMPWVSYSGLTDDELAALHAYIRSVPPVRNQVQTYEAASD